MFGQQNAVRIRAAEDALTEGRLDEALTIAASPDVAETRQGRNLLDRLGKAYLQRGQDRLLSRRFNEAIADFEKAGRCGCKPETVSEWRVRAQDAWHSEQKGAGDKATALATAETHLRRGRLAEALQVLVNLPAEDAEAMAMHARISEEKQKAVEATSAANAALAAGDLAAAAAHLQAARQRDFEVEGATVLESRIVETVVNEAGRAFAEGRLDRIRQQLGSLGGIGRAAAKRIDLEEVLRLAGETAAAIEANRFARAGVLLGRLAQLAPAAAWIGEVRQHLTALDDHHRAVLAGPLGLLLGADVGSQVSMAAAGEVETMRRPSPRPAGPAAREAAPVQMRAPSADSDDAGRMTTRMLLRIDGVGSFLLLRGERISIGRAGPGASADLQLLSDLSDRQAEVVRAGEDYFIASNAGVELAGHPVDYALLQDGDRIRLGRRIRLTFLRPSKKSSTAALDLGEGVRTTTDCRRVILWSGPLILGSTRESHVRLSPSVGGAILMEREGRLYFRPMSDSGKMSVITPGSTAEWGELRFSLQPWSEE